MRDTLLFLRDEDERRAFYRAAGGGVAFRPCLSIDAVNSDIALNPEALMCDTSCGLLEDRNLLDRLNTHGVKLIVRCPLTRSTVRDLVALAPKFPSFRLSLRTVLQSDDLTGDVRSLMSEPDGGPVGFTISRIMNLVSADALYLIVVALILGRRRTSVCSYAAICGLAPRSLQASAERLKIPPPHRLLLWGQACWMTWRLDRYGWNMKRAAVAGGFRNSSAMASSLRAITAKASRTFEEYSGPIWLTNEIQRATDLKGEPVIVRMRKSTPGCAL